MYAMYDSMYDDDMYYTMYDSTYDSMYDDDYYYKLKEE